jgi:hypothetical protein
VPLFVNPDHVFRARDVLDLGCGRGVRTAEAVKEWKNARFVRVDSTDVFSPREHLRTRCGLTEGAGGVLCCDGLLWHLVE